MAPAPVAATTCQDGQLVHRHARWPQADDKTCAILIQDKDDAAQLRFARRWVNCHVDAAAAIGKPVVLAEFGKKGGGPAREEFYRKVRLCGSSNIVGADSDLVLTVSVQRRCPVGRRGDVQPSRSSSHMLSPDHAFCR